MPTTVYRTAPFGRRKITAAGTTAIEVVLPPDTVEVACFPAGGTWAVDIGGTEGQALGDHAMPLPSDGWTTLDTPGWPPEGARLWVETDTVGATIVVVAKLGGV